MHVLSCSRYGFAVANILYLRQLLRGMAYKPRMVYPASERVRSKIWTISLNKYSIERNSFRSLNGFSRIFECKNTRKGNIPTALYKLYSHFSASAKAMKNTSYTAVAKYDIKAISMCITVMYHHGHIKMLCQVKLILKAFDLECLIKAFVMIIKSDLTDSDYLVLTFVLQKPFYAKQFITDTVAAICDILGV